MHICIICIETLFGMCQVSLVWVLSLHHQSIIVELHQFNLQMTYYPKAYRKEPNIENVILMSLVISWKKRTTKTIIWPQALLPTIGLMLNLAPSSKGHIALPNLHGLHFQTWHKYSHNSSLTLTHKNGYSCSTQQDGTPTHTNPNTHNILTRKPTLTLHIDFNHKYPFKQGSTKIYIDQRKLQSFIFISTKLKSKRVDLTKRIGNPNMVETLTFSKPFPPFFLTHPFLFFPSRNLLPNEEKQEQPRASERSQGKKRKAPSPFKEKEYI